MVSLNKRQSGFTIVELLIVIVVIGILATLVIVTFTGIQQKARDSKRKTDIGALQTTLENYYGSNNTFPTLADLNSTTWQKANIPGFDPNALQDPKGNSQTVAATASATQYGYVVTPSGCDDTANAANPCTNYVLTADLETGTGQTFVKQSNN